MGLDLDVKNNGSAPVFLTAHKLDAEGRFTAVYTAQISKGETRALNAEMGETFMLSETMPAHNVLLPRGVPPVRDEPAAA